MSKKILAAMMALALGMGGAGTAMAAPIGPLPADDPAPGSTYFYTTCDDTVAGLQYEAFFQQEAGPWSWEPMAGFYPACTGASGPSSSIRGTAFEDLNGNGKRDANEPEMGGAWYKVSDGGGWFVCGWVGGDSTYSVPVTHAGMTYFVYAIAPPGWRTTTPLVKASAIKLSNGAYLYNDLGFVRDPSVKTVEGCDQYHPVRR